MSHTLHRIKSETGKYDDYVILIMPARGINNQNSVEVFRKYLDLLYPFHPVNMGGMKMGTLVTNTFEEIEANISPDAPMMHAVFRDRDTLIEAMKAIRDADYGYSVVVSGAILLTSPWGPGEIRPSSRRRRSWKSRPCADMP